MAEALARTKAAPQEQRREAIFGRAAGYSASVSIDEQRRHRGMAILDSRTEFGPVPDAREAL